MVRAIVLKTMVEDLPMFDIVNSDEHQRKEDVTTQK